MIRAFAEKSNRKANESYKNQKPSNPNPVG
jgi:hypothetical protein